MRALALEHLHSIPWASTATCCSAGIQVHRVRLDLGEALPDWREYDLLVVMGGGMGVYEEDAYPWLVAEKRAIREAVATGSVTRKLRRPLVRAEAPRTQEQSAGDCITSLSALAL
jgi:hypothetical protein